MPSFRANHPKAGQCRNDLDYCEDCMATEVDKIYNVHKLHHVPKAMELYR
jgi:hypothetical protein